MIEGTGYWDQIRALENECEQTTLSTNLAESDVANRLGTVASLLYRLACCHWGCHGREHVFEYLSGRTCTSTNSAFRLIGFGYYDEALALTRNIAEIGNLSHLFLSDNSHIRAWLDSTDQERKRSYSPVGVRKSLEDLGAVVPTDQDRYSWLCEIGTHVTPKTLPQSHNMVNRPILGKIYQANGVEAALNGLAWSVCTVSGPMSKLAIFEQAPAERLLRETIELAKVLFRKPAPPLSDMD